MTKSSDGFRGQFTWSFGSRGRLRALAVEALERRDLLAHLITPTGVFSGTNGTDMWPASNLIDGSGLSADVNGGNFFSVRHAEASETNSWLTEDPLSEGGDYFDEGPDPVLIFALGEEQLLTHAVVWGFQVSETRSSRNSASRMSFEFSRDGGDTYGEPVIASISQLQSSPVAVGEVRADTVRVTITDNFFSDDGYETAGERVGLGEIRFVNAGKLTASDVAGPDFFAGAVAISGDTMVVGAHHQEDNAYGDGYGLAHVYVREQGIWREQAQLMAPGVPFDSRFGHRVAIDGDTIAVSAPYELGGVYVFEREEGTWSHEATLSVDGQVMFGFEMAMSGDTIVVQESRTVYVFTREGNQWTREAALFDEDGKGLRGRVAISSDTIVVGGFGFAHVFGRDGDTWNREARLESGRTDTRDYFGHAVAIEGDTIVVGAPEDYHDAPGSGSAYVFTRGDGSWSQTAKLTASDGQIEDALGESVAISGGSIVVGARGDDDGGESAGSAYIFVRDDGGWREDAKLSAGDPHAGNRFGGPVAVSDDTIVVGAYDQVLIRHPEGAAYVFARIDGDWSQQAKMTSDDAGDRFGHAVAVSEDGIVIGAPGDDGSGAAYFVNADSVSEPSQNALKLTAPDRWAIDRFGQSVAATHDFRIVVGAPGNAEEGVPGAAYVFDEISPWTRDGKFKVKLTAEDGGIGDEFGSAVAAAGDTVVVGAPRDDGAGDDSGAIHVFTRDDENWARRAKLVAGDASPHGQFGRAVAMGDETIVVGAYADDGADPGAAYVFAREGNSWIETKLIVDDLEPGDGFGYSVAVLGDTIVVGAPEGGQNGEESGAAYVFVDDGNDWALRARITADDAASGDRFGHSVALAPGGTIVVGAPGDDGTGSVYLFNLDAGQWIQREKMTAPDSAPGAGDSLGHAVAVSSDGIFAGAPLDDESDEDSGAVHYFPIHAAIRPYVLSGRVNDSRPDPHDLSDAGPQPSSWMVQRSQIDDIVIAFSEPVILDVSDLRLVNLGINAPVDPDQAFPLTSDHLSWQGNVLSLGFARDELPEGVYELEISASVADLDGNPLDGDGDGIGGDAFSLSFHRLRGDWNGDGGVSILDFSTLAYWFGLPVSRAPEYVDANNDGGVSIFDFTVFADNFGAAVTMPNSLLAAPDDPSFVTPTSVDISRSQDPSSRRSRDETPIRDRALLEVLAHWRIDRIGGGNWQRFSPDRESEQAFEFLPGDPNDVLGPIDNFAR